MSDAPRAVGEQVTVRLDPATRALVERRVAATGRRLSDVLREMIRGEPADGELAELRARVAALEDRLDALARRTDPRFTDR